MKKWIAALLCAAMLVMPLSGMVLVNVSAASATYAVQALDFSAGYASTEDGTLDLSTVKKYDAYEQYNMRYLNENTTLSSTSGIPYQVFDVALNGKTSGTVAVHYSGATKPGERIALRAYNVSTKTWDTLGTFKGTGSVSADVNVATYNDGGVIHVAAVLDYVTNGSNTMMWSTDPQHYTKFEDLHEYYYTIYQFAAEQYQQGNVGYILTTGDLVDDLPTTNIAPYQWAVADRAMKYVEAVGMPNGLVSGNHDVGTLNATDFVNTAPNANYSRFWETFPASRYENERWYGGSFNNNASHYDLITIGNVDFIVLFLGYGVEATDDTIAWANEALRTYSHRTAIVATHQYLDALDATYANRGKLIFDTIVSPNPNVKMVVCGHDDGSVCREVKAADGRTVYEVLSDYQFVEAENRDFYANEHWIGSVDSCCGDGYVRFMTVEGDKLSNITYSPVTGRYNPYGDCEKFTIDLDCGTPDRSMATTRFSAAVVGSATSATNVDRIQKDGSTYSAITYASVPSAPAKTDGTAWPTSTYGLAATPSNPFAAHAAVEAPQVAFKVDLLEATNLGTHPSFNERVNFGDYALNLSVDLNRTPYLYYSFAQPDDSKFTFAFINDTTNAPWLTFLDATKGGATMNRDATNWDSYAGNGAQYFYGSATGCIDMRTLTTVSDATTWEVEQLNIYGTGSSKTVISYMFFGSEPLSTIGSNFGAPATPEAPSMAHASKNMPAVEEKVDVLRSVHLNDNAVIYHWVTYGDNNLNLKVDLTKTPYLYYSFSLDPNSTFTFGFFNENSNNPWLTFLDVNKGGATMNSGNANWDAYTNGEQYFTGSMTGCIDMRQFLYDKSKQTWEIDQVNFYNPNAVPVAVNYMFFGSEAIGGPSADSQALDALLTKANNMDTSAYTSASVTALTAAKKRATYVDRADAAATSRAYAALNEAIGGLTKPVASDANVSNLTSLAVYSLSPSSWKCGSTGLAPSETGSFMRVESYDGGMRIRRSSSATHNWPSINYTGSNKAYKVTPYGGVYLKLDLEANVAWAIQLVVKQYGIEQKVRLNQGILNAIGNHLLDSYAGRYQNVYDVSEVFKVYGFDATAPFEVTGMNILSIGANNDYNIYRHIEILTGKAGSVSYQELESLLERSKNLTSSMYTSASWSTFTSALSKAKTAMSTAGLTQPAINLEVTRLENAVKGLVPVSYKEPYGSLLPSDIGAWGGKSAKATRSNNVTYVNNTVGDWAPVEHVFTEARRVRVQKNQLVVDISVQHATNILLKANGEWFSISKYITNNLVGEDAMSGTYKLNIPLNKIFGSAMGATIEGIRVWSVGDIGNNTVEIRRMLIEPIDDYVFDRTLNYGPAATPSNSYQKHAAKNGPTVTNKIDVLAACGLEGATEMHQNAVYGDQKMHLTIDLNKTPYLYYSFVQPSDSKFTVGFYNDSTNAPWFTFLDATKGGNVMNKDIANWDAHSGASQYFQGSVTGCVDVRTMLKDSSATEWRINQVSFYTSGSNQATVSYLYFGSAPLDDGYVEDPVTLGDVNMDGTISSKDARMVLMYVLGIGDTVLNDKQKEAADFDGSNGLNTSDVRSILMYSLG